MRRAALFALALAAACRGAASPTAQRSAASDASADAARAPATPCEQLMAEGARAVAAWRRHSPAVTDAARWRAIAALNHCEAGEGGAWATVLDAPTGNAPRDASAGRFKLVWLADGGARSEALPAIVDDGDTFTLRPNEDNWSSGPAGTTTLGAWTLFDYDGDHVAEALIPLTGRAADGAEASHVLVWQATASRVQPFEPAMGLHPVGVGDFDSDGRPDLFTHADLVTRYVTANASSTLHGPRLAAVSRPGGVFLTSSGAALRHGRTQCPAPPSTYFSPDGAPGPAAMNVACAVLWRVPVSQIVNALHRESATIAPDARPPTATLNALVEMAQSTPQADVRDAVSFRFEEIPPSSLDAGDAPPRGVYTLHVEGGGGGFEPTVNLGELAGTCSVDTPARAIVAGLRCWWAGAGDEFQVLRRGPSLVAQRRAISEASAPTAWRDVGRATVNPTSPLRAGDID